MRKQETIEMFRKHSPKTPVVGTTSKYFVCRTREARYGGNTTKATLARAQKCSTSFPVPVAVHKTVGAKSPYCNYNRQRLRVAAINRDLTYRKQIFCSGHAQKLNNWLQPAVVFTLATPHSLFWRSVDNVAVYCKDFSPFCDLPFFFVRHIMKDLSGVYCQTFFDEKFYNEHPWGRKIR